MLYSQLRRVLPGRVRGVPPEHVAPCPRAAPPGQRGDDRHRGQQQQHPHHRYQQGGQEPELQGEIIWSRPLLITNIMKILQTALVIINIAFLAST